VLNDGAGEAESPPASNDGFEPPSFAGSGSVSGAPPAIANAAWNTAVNAASDV
jgi:hypothetical protein